jgi:hypothetical protein
MSTVNNLEAQFHAEMIRIYERAKSECSYNATRFLQMVTQMGGLEAAKALLRTDILSDGLVELWGHNGSILQWKR